MVEIVDIEGDIVYDSWSQEYRDMEQSINQTTAKLHQFFDIDRKDFMIDEVANGIKVAYGYEYTRLSLLLRTSELKTSPIEVKRLLEDLGMVLGAVKVRIELRKKINEYERSFSLRFRNFRKQKDTYGIDIDSSGSLLISPSEVQVVGIHANDTDSVVEGDSERAKMLGEVYMGWMRSRYSNKVPHPFIYKILTAGSDWLIDNLNSRHIDKSTAT